ncbi:helix-turn-helix domain-containing protein [Natrononativus amylolyticus]|uniref:helix-turn-helix domain-containing protein n=1 Tax=Natrononativus amylolyticus TaxID=2963434 RepID=UPI0020CC1652|nr:helix-turn-helix domain-containing protein [Natrononativus amylolyticus]
MATIAEFRLGTAGTALGSTLTQHPSIDCEFERVVESEHPAVWFRDTERDTVDAALEADPSVDRFEPLTGDDGRWLYEIEFGDEFWTLGELFLSHRGTLLSAKGRADGWVLRVRYPDRDYLRLTYEELRETDAAVDVGRIYDLTEESSLEIGLTPEQYEALTAAVEHGYFEIPRRISMQNLATELDISHQALSERLRRAYGTLANAELTAVSDPEPAELD